MAPTRINTDFIKSTLKRNNGTQILKAYEKKKTLTLSLQRKAIRIIAQFLVNSLHGSQPKPKIKRKVAVALRATFPNVWTDLNVLMPSNSSEGRLGNAFRSAAKSYQKHQSNIDEELDIEDETESMQAEEYTDESDGGDGEGNDECETVEEVREVYDDKIQFLMKCVVTVQTKPRIETMLSETSEKRRELILNGATDLFFNLYKTNAEFLLYDFGLLWPDQVNSMISEKGKLQRFVPHIENIFKLDANKIKPINDEVGTFQRLILLLGRTKGGAKNAINDLVHVVEESSSPEVIQNVCSRVQQPSVIIKKGQVLQFILSFDGQPIYLSTTQFTDFISSLDLLIKVYFLFNIKYPESLKKFYTFLACAIYNLATPCDKTSTLVDLVSRYKNFEGGVETESDEDSSSSDESGNDMPMESQVVMSEPDQTDSDEDSNSSDESGMPMDSQAVMSEPEQQSDRDLNNDRFQLLHNKLNHLFKSTGEESILLSDLPELLNGHDGNNFSQNEINFALQRLTDINAYMIFDELVFPI